MIKFHSIILAFVFLLSEFIYASETHVRVRILKSFQPIIVSAHQLTINNMALHSSLLKQAKWKIERQKKDNKWQWKLKDLKSNNELWFSQDEITINGDFLELNYNIHLPSGLKLYAKKQRIDVVSILNLEEYLMGVVPNEMPAAWPEEALKAQAIASRSYTMSVINERQHLHFDLEASVEDQVFNWVPKNESLTRWHQKVKTIISETKGKILSHNGVGIYKAYFHADSGGQTELAKFVWGEDNNDPSSSVHSAYVNSPNQFWNRQWPIEQVASWLNNSESKTLKDLKVLSRSPSGRVKQLEIVWEDKTQVISGQEFRKKLAIHV